ncbi:hypothetical protein [Natronincola ferrireducens]|uniref:Helix-turn-helix domain-containing protein n=1 Tax=Natronincola ferrireducens TaxID=393762 RepID=A0A1G8X1D9_9FIRM|nr:hypothetical protein [Natronincola ferrireducens]SDJ84468.1 hypothetical protein SAMN05660472_00092 [Natronincola ferrireducens]
MLFYLQNRNKTIKELRKNASLTVKELAKLMDYETVRITELEDVKLKDLPKDMRQQIIPILRQDYLDNISY